MNSDLTKLALRRSFLKKRHALSDQEHEDMSFAIANNCLKLPIWHLDYYHLYLPIRAKAEIDTTLILTLLQGKDKQVILPRIKGSELEHILLTDITKLKTNTLGIAEPEKGIKIHIVSDHQIIKLIKNGKFNNASHIGMFLFYKKKYAR